MSVYERLELERIEARQARLRAERERNELAAMRHESASLRLDLALIKLRRALKLKYRPDQPRVPAGNPDGGQWTSEGGGEGTIGGETVDVDVTGSTEEQPSRRIDLAKEDARGGHTTTGHVAKSHSYLIRQLRERQSAANARGHRGDDLRVGSFTSLEAANRLVSVWRGGTALSRSAIAQRLPRSYGLPPKLRVGSLMRALKTTFYDTPTGVVFTVTWDNEAEFLAAREFLHNLTGGLVDTRHDADFCCLLTVEQREAMYTYREELQRRKQR